MLDCLFRPTSPTVPSSLGLGFGKTERVDFLRNLQDTPSNAPHEPGGSDSLNQLNFTPTHGTTSQGRHRPVPPPATLGEAPPVYSKADPNPTPPKAKQTAVRSARDSLAAPKSGTWTCHACTYENPKPLAAVCEVCQTARAATTNVLTNSPTIAPTPNNVASGFMTTGPIVTGNASATATMPMILGFGPSSSTSVTGADREVINDMLFNNGPEGICASDIDAALAPILAASSAMNNSANGAAKSTASTSATGSTSAVVTAVTTVTTAPCAECGKTGEDGATDYEGSGEFFCNSCWEQFNDNGSNGGELADEIPQPPAHHEPAMPDRTPPLDTASTSATSATSTVVTTTPMPSGGANAQQVSDADSTMLPPDTASLRPLSQTQKPRPRSCLKSWGSSESERHKSDMSISWGDDLQETREYEKNDAEWEDPFADGHMEDDAEDLFNSFAPEDVGSRVSVEGLQRLPTPGLLRFVGLADHRADKRPILGVELDDPVGRNDGIVQGRRYFSCQSNHGVLCIPGNVTLLELRANIPVTMKIQMGKPAATCPWECDVCSTENDSWAKTCTMCKCPCPDAEETSPVNSRRNSPIRPHSIMVLGSSSGESSTDGVSNRAGALPPSIGGLFTSPMEESQRSVNPLVISATTTPQSTRDSNTSTSPSDAQNVQVSDFSPKTPALMSLFGSLPPTSSTPLSAAAKDDVEDFKSMRRRSVSGGESSSWRAKHETEMGNSIHARGSVTADGGGTSIAESERDAAGPQHTVSTHGKNEQQATRDNTDGLDAKVASGADHQPAEAEVTPSKKKKKKSIYRSIKKRISRKFKKKKKGPGDDLDASALDGDNEGSSAVHEEEVSAYSENVDGAAYSTDTSRPETPPLTNIARSETPSVISTSRPEIPPLANTVGRETPPLVSTEEPNSPSLAGSDTPLTPLDFDENVEMNEGHISVTNPGTLSTAAPPDSPVRHTTAVS